MSRSVYEALLHHLERQLDRTGLPLSRTRFIAGVSGGVDSMVLLSLFHDIGAAVHAVHINYRTRGVDSDRDEQMVRDWCEKHHIPLHVHHCRARESQGNFQDWARNRRYGIFDERLREAEQQVEKAAIATAHHRDDQLETLIQKIMRGASLASWTGMQPFDGTRFRPLLSWSKQQIIEAARQAGLPWREDATNTSSAYARNFLRREWVPQLDRLFPGWQENLLKLPERAEEYRSMAGYILRGLRISSGSVDREGFLALSLPLRRAVFHALVAEQHPEAILSNKVLQELHRLDDLQTGSTLQLSGTLGILVDQDRLTLLDTAGEEESREDEQPVTFTLEELHRRPLMFHGLQFRLDTPHQADYKRQLHLNADRLPPALELRPWRPGDRFRPFGMQGTQKVSDFLTHRKIRPSRKKQVRVLAGFDQNVIAVIFPPDSGDGAPGSIDDRYRCDEQTSISLVIENMDPIL